MGAMAMVNYSSMQQTFRLQVVVFAGILNSLNSLNSYWYIIREERL